jgi:hypothetical protein
MREVSFSARAARSSRRLRISSSSRHPTTAPLAVSPKEAQLIPIAFPQPRQSFPLRRSKLRKTAWGRTQARSCALRPSGFFSFASIERGPRAVSRVIELTQGTILALLRTALENAGAKFDHHVGTVLPRFIQCDKPRTFVQTKAEHLHRNDRPNGEIRVHLPRAQTASAFEDCYYLVVSAW